jgi:phosphatidylglycerol---prolipoprotein diacylglyceryl transferase
MRKWLLWFFCLGTSVLLIYSLTEVFKGHIILPQTFHLGFLTVHYYGLTMAVAVAAGFYLAMVRARKYGLNLTESENLLFWLAIGGFIGARLYHVASSYFYYATHPLDVLKIWNGGLSIYGAIIGGLIALIICKKLYKLQTTNYNLLDWLAPSLVLGQIIGRFGNLFNYEAFGYPTNLPWKMFVPSQFRPQIFQAYNFFHPFFLYEILGNLVILFLLLKSIRPKNPGSLFFSYLLLYNLLRFALEFLRIDSTFIGQFRLNAIASLLLVLVAAIGLILIRKNAKVP